MTNRVATQTDPRGHVTELDHYPRGNLAITTRGGVTTVNGYAPNGDRTSLADTFSQFPRPVCAEGRLHRHSPIAAGDRAATATDFSVTQFPATSQSILVKTMRPGGDEKMWIGAQFSCVLQTA